MFINYLWKFEKNLSILSQYVSFCIYWTHNSLYLTGPSIMLVLFCSVVIMHYCPFNFYCRCIHIYNRLLLSRCKPSFQFKTYFRVAKIGIISSTFASVVCYSITCSSFVEKTGPWCMIFGLVNIPTALHVGYLSLPCKSECLFL